MYRKWFSDHRVLLNITSMHFHKNKKNLFTQNIAIGITLRSIIRTIQTYDFIKHSE